MRSAWCLLLALPLTGCLYHEARVEPAAGLDASAGRGATGVRVHDGAPSAQQRGPLPAEIPAIWVTRSEDGGLNIGRATACSPLPWWQRFPCDLAVDLWPGDVVITTVATVTPKPVTQRSADDITAEARAHGYAP